MDCSDFYDYLDPLMFTIPCGPELPNPITKIFMDTLGNVYDQHGNFIGHGIRSSENTVSVDMTMPEIVNPLKEEILRAFREKDLNN